MARPMSRLLLLLLAVFLPSTLAATCSQVKPSSNTTLCAVRGLPKLSLENYSSGQPLIASSLLECASQCWRRIETRNTTSHAAQRNGEDCVLHPQVQYDASLSNLDVCGYCDGILFNPKTGFCQLTSVDFNTHTFQPNSKSGTVYYSSSCFDCGSICSQPFGTELIDNGNFKGELLGPWTSLTRGAIVKGGNTSNAYLCNPALGLRPSIGPGVDVCGLQQGFNSCPYSLYSLEFDFQFPETRETDKSLTVAVADSEYTIQLQRNATAPGLTTSRVFFRGSQTQVQDYESSYPLQFQFAAGNSTASRTAEADYRLSNVRLKRVSGAPATQAGPGSSIPLKPTGHNQVVRVTPGALYLFTLSLVAPSGQERISFEVFLSSIGAPLGMSSFADIAYTFFRDKADNAPVTYSIPYRVQSSKLGIVVRESSIYFDSIKVHSLSLVRLKDQDFGGS